MQPTSYDELWRKTWGDMISIQVVEHLLDDVTAFRNIARMANNYVFISTIQGYATIRNFN